MIAHIVSPEHYALRKNSWSHQNSMYDKTGTPKIEYTFYYKEEIWRRAKKGETILFDDGSP